MVRGLHHSVHALHRSSASGVVRRYPYMLNADPPQMSFNCCYGDALVISCLRHWCWQTRQCVSSVLAAAGGVLVFRLTQVLEEAERRIEDLDAYNRRTSLLITGVPETSGEATDNLVLDVGRAAGLNLTADNLDRSHRLGRPQPGKVRPIIAKFATTNARQKLFDKRKELTAEKTMIYPWMIFTEKRDGIARDELDYNIEIGEGHLEGTGEPWSRKLKALGVEDESAHIADLHKAIGLGKAPPGADRASRSRSQYHPRLRRCSSWTSPVPRFKGDLLAWPEFWEIFEAYVHTNRGYSSVQKLCFLRQHLDGPAARAIQGLPLTADNYMVAVQILKDRFGRDDIRKDALITRLLNLPAVTSADNLKSLRRLVDEEAVLVERHGPKNDRTLRVPLDEGSDASYTSSSVAEEPDLPVIGSGTIECAGFQERAKESQRPSQQGLQQKKKCDLDTPRTKESDVLLDKLAVESRGCAVPKEEILPLLYRPFK
ncbi:hypothetical protein FJT64_021151 [Amphibalanus amphitrite]|uniref:Uncharacterized protein n=1 Tax=Amphibalanus amphitrite TaxID=1232801 RepID=A0A6A4WZ99_AMPAM|nr:hypothetical protein FJT64_021151 [Amphibalanus amphitrite]